MYVVAGESPLATNRFDAPDAVRIEQRQARADELILPPHSFAMLVLQVRRVSACCRRFPAAQSKGALSMPGKALEAKPIGR